jgi:hypothetical protein
VKSISTGILAELGQIERIGRMHEVTADNIGAMNILDYPEFTDDFKVYD